MTEINPVQSQAPSLPPVTKEETDSFFQRLATNFVRMSNQDRELQNMRYDLQRLNARLDEYVEENSKLKNEITTAYELMKSIEQERDTAKRDLDEASHHVAVLQEKDNANNTQIAQLNNDNAELRRQISTLQAQVSQSNSERDAFKDNCDYWQRLATKFEDKLNGERERANQLGHDYASERATREKLQTRLDQMKAIISPPEEQEQTKTNDDNIPF